MIKEWERFRLPPGWQQKQKEDIVIPMTYRPTDVFVRRLRAALGISREQLCEYMDAALGEQTSLLGPTVTTIARWERGESHPRYWPEEPVLRGFAWQIWKFRGVVVAQEPIQ